MNLKKYSLLLSVFLTVGIFSGCSKKIIPNQPDSSAVKPSEEKGEKVTLRIWRPANIIDPKVDPVMQEIAKKLNVDIEIVTAPWEQETNTLNLKVTSKENLDLVLMQTGVPWVQWAKDGLFYNIGDMIKGKEKQYPYISSITSAESFAGFKVDGKVYYIPGAHHGQDTGMYVRQDWLNKIGKPVPKTLEEVYDVLKEFKKQGLAPDAAFQVSMNGVDNFGDLDPLMHAFGGSFGGFFEDYVVKDGKVEALETTQNTKDGFVFLNKLYREGLINTDFSQLKNVDEANNKYLYKDKAGMLWTSRVNEFETNLKKAAPNASLIFVPPVSASGHQFVPSQGVAWWMFTGIPTVSKHPEKALEFVEYINSEEGRKLLVAGVQGRHYTTFKDGVYDRNNAIWEKDYDVKANGYDYPLWWGFTNTVHGYIPVTKYPTFEEALKNEEIYLSQEEASDAHNWKTQIKEGAQYNTPNPLHAVFIDSAVQPRADIQSKVKAVYFLKMITAKDEAEVNKFWDEYIKAWKDAGGENVIKAYQDFYDKNLKK